MEYIFSSIVIIGLLIYISSKIKKTNKNTIPVIVKNPQDKEEIKMLEKLAFMLYYMKKDHDVILVIDQIEKKCRILTKEEYSHRAICLQELGYHLDAIDDFNEALRMFNWNQIDRNDANNFYMRGLSHRSVGNFLEAKEDLKKAVYYEPDIVMYSTMLELINDQILNKIIKEQAEKEGKLKRRIRSDKYPEISNPNEEEFLEAFIERLKEGVSTAPYKYIEEYTDILNHYETNPDSIRNLIR